MTDNNSAPCVVLDTNVWISQNLLRSPSASALLFSLLQAKGMLGFPEVVELEVRKQALRVARENRERIVQQVRHLSDMLGTSPNQLIDEQDLPTDDQITATVQERIVSLEKLLVRVPFTHEHARRALERVRGSPRRSSRTLFRSRQSKRPSWMKSFQGREQVRYHGLPASGQRTAARSARSVRHAVHQQGLHVPRRARLRLRRQSLSRSPSSACCAAIACTGSLARTTIPITWPAPPPGPARIPASAAVDAI